VLYITQASPESITWLSVADAAKYGIDVQLADARSMPQSRPATGPTPAVVMPLTPPRTTTVGAMAVGVASRGVAWGYATGFAMPSGNAARSAAAEMCRTASAGDTDARAHCEVVVIFHNKCVASAVDPKARTPGAGWGLSSSQREADSQALEQCRATAGYDRAEFCVVTDRHCDGSGK
jgi:Domain of unknown function (DUF4189)